jgi:hypothetical protein
MSADKRVSKLFTDHSNPRIKEAYVKTRNAPLVMDMHSNDYKMFDPEYDPESNSLYSLVSDGIYINNFDYYPYKGTVSELYYTTKYPEYTHKVTKDELNRLNANYHVNIPKGTKVRSINM